jgi:hypothetical protein
LATAGLQAVAALAEASGRFFGSRAVIYAAEKRHVLVTSEKIRAFIDSIRGKKDRMIEGEVVNKDDDDG